MDPDPKIRGREATEIRSGYAEAEYTALRVLTEAECSYTPKFLSRASGKQDDPMWVPNGYGLPQMTLCERNKVRSAFKEALK